MLTIGECAGRLAVHLDTMRRYVREGKIAGAVKHRNKILIPERSLLEFEKSLTVPYDPPRR